MTATFSGFLPQTNLSTRIVDLISNLSHQKVFTNLDGKLVTLLHFWTSLQSAFDGGRRDGAESGDEASEDGGGQGARVVDAPRVRVREAGGGGRGQLLAVKFAEDEVTGNN